MQITNSIHASARGRWRARWTLLLACVAATQGCRDDAASHVSAEQQPASVAAAVSTATLPSHPDDGAETPAITWDDAPPMPTVPSWIADAIFYQIFPERFRNGDPANDPTRASIESPEGVPDSWEISPWTSDWYGRAAWEQQAGDNFYDNGVFNRRYGGDLQGVLDKLDYLQELGVNTIYFNPLFYGRSLHKYDAASMHHIDPYFGPDPAGDLKLIETETSDPKSWKWTASDKLFLKLIDELHARGMRVIIDGVFNHTGRDFFAFADLRTRGEKSPYRDWYIVQHFDDPNTVDNEFRYKGWWGVETLPEFADADGGGDLHPGPKQYVFDITRRWMDPNGDGNPRDGIDGWRLDVANEVPAKFWHDWHGVVRKVNPQAYTVAEVWDDAREFLAAAGFTATMNYHAFALPTKGFLIDGRLTAHDFGRELQLRRQEYPAAMQFALQNLIDSHDTDRVASMIVNRPIDETYEQPDRFDYDVSSRSSSRHDRTYSVARPDDVARRIQRMVALFQMTYLGAPMVYYGDEAGMWGGDDPCDRWPMFWEDLAYEPQAGDPLNRERKVDEVAFDRDLFEFYQRAIELRRKNDVLRHGAWRAEFNDDGAKVFAFRRTLGNEQALVAFNRGDDEYRWTLPADAEDLQVALATGSGDNADVEVTEADGQRSILIPALSGVLLTTP